jgi:DNA-binding transcriptional LysR family regulator
MPNHWPHWFEAAGLRVPVRPAGEVVFDGNPMAMQAVLDGVGVALEQLAYVSDALAAGRLVAPFQIVAHRPETFFWNTDRSAETTQRCSRFETGSMARPSGNAASDRSC